MKRGKKRGRSGASTPAGPAAGAAGWGRGGGEERSQVSDEEALSAARAIRAYWEEGRGSLAERPKEGGDFESYAGRKGRGVTYLRKARQFANPRGGGTTRPSSTGCAHSSARRGRCSGSPTSAP